MRLPLPIAAVFAFASVNVKAAFVHPGLLHTAADFTRIAANVNAKKEPWLTGWNKLIANSHAQTTYAARPQTVVYRGSDGTHSENYGTLYNDAHAAYQLALRWKISGDTQYAVASGKILSAWASSLTGIGGSSDKFLASGIYGYQMANAAEILRGYAPWANANLTAFSGMMTRVFLPMNLDFFTRHNDAKIDHYWANWDLCNMASMMAIGVLTDNSTAFNYVVNYFKTGAGNGAIDKMVWKLYTEAGSSKSLGQGQEAGRDQGHATLDFALLGVIAQQAYNQGQDLFAYESNKILAGSEYMAKYNLGNDVPYTSYTNSDVTQSVISDASRGNIRPMGELLFAHYSSLKGLNASWTGQYRDLVVSQAGGAEGGGGDYGSNSGGYDQLGHGTLLFRLK
ncbi:GPI anchored protein [Exidia glandulosa HHB12029]|uniref:GPI anchored protein n=1 Tax=Exidia glandulosa HHB12029 TaxID=1314781 RepID=A0A165FW63_EXIGL|nr:GPI anchored protein [Exidia glandulosa HHB12029]